MQLSNSFNVPGSPSEAWAILMDVPGVVGCMPGVELVSCEPDGSYKGKLAVKIGPVALKFNGTAQFEDVDEANRTATIRAKGGDQQGRGNAGAVAKFRVVEDGSESTVLIDTELQLSGLVAQYGRASGVISAVSQQLISVFAANLRQKLVKTNGVGDVGVVQATEPVSGSKPSLGFGFFLRAVFSWLLGSKAGAK